MKTARWGPIYLSQIAMGCDEGAMAAWRFGHELCARCDRREQFRRGGSVVITTFTTGVNGLRSLVIDLTADCDRYSTDIRAHYEATLERSRQPLSRVLEA